MLVHKTPFFYGWVIVAVAMVSGAFTVGLIVWGMGVFITPMQEELGWSRSTIFLALALGGVASGILGPLLGPLFDHKRGPRTFMLLGSLLTGLTVLYMRWVQTIWAYLLVFGVLGGIGRFSMQLGALAVPKWFVRRRGIAQATARGGSTSGALFFPIMLETLIAHFGWRDTWFITGVALMLLLVPASFLIIRSPEDVGLLPDGASPNEGRPGEPGHSAGRSAVTEENFTRGEAIRTRQFWLLVCAVSVGMLSIRGVIPNLVPFFVSRGLLPSLAAASSSAYAIVSIAIGFFWGYVVDRTGHRGPYIIVCALVASALILIFSVRTTSMLFISMAYLGVGLGGFFFLNGLVVVNTFGRQHIGAVRGAMQPFNNVATFGGPLVLGAIYDLSGGYGWVFAMAVAGFLVSLTAAVFLRPLGRPATASLSPQPAPPG